MRYRVEQLAAACDVSVDTVRYYQSRGLLQAPEREGRLAWYGPEHAERIASIKARIKASIDDPRPPVPIEEAFQRVRRHIEELAERDRDPVSPRRS